MEKDNKKLLVAGGLSGVFASLCCLGPVILIALGVGSVSSVLSIGKYTWLFTTIALLFFAFAAFLFLKKKSCCSAKGLKQEWKPLLISFVVLVLLLLLLKYWLAPFLAGIVYR